MSYLGISFKNNPEQQEFIRLIYENNTPIVICTGAAGVGKTWTALVAAIELKQNRKYDKIYYIRDSVSVGHEIGSLPGSAEEKMEPYWGPVYDSLESICKISEYKLNVRDLAAQIEVLPLAFLRGRSLRNAIVIADEVESYDLNALKTVISRVGDYSKVILLGSYNQIDDWRQRTKEQCDFKRVADKLKQSEYVGFVELTKSMRSKWTVEIDELLSELAHEN